MSVRTRFAPSPTGSLHIGSVRTALFSWLVARQHGGQFLLRIEDTDRERSTPEATDAILDGMTWLGLDWDEGPVFQSRRTPLYRRIADDLLAHGHLYRCWCTPDELEARRAVRVVSGGQPAYDRRCRDRTASPDGRTTFVLRLRMPLEGETVIDDLVKGRIVYQNGALDDFVVARSDGSPVFNFCVVCDDVDMAITHVIRGDDHVANTARQIHLFRAMGATLPRFGHLPLLLGVDKARLSKRHGALSVTAYRDLGYPPDAVVNYLARLGWAHGDQEIFSRDELIRSFALERVSPAAGVFNPEKLAWVSFQHLRIMAPARLAGLLPPYLQRCGLPVPEDGAWLARVCALLRERAKTLVELAEAARCFVEPEVRLDPTAAARFLQAPIAPVLEDLADRLAALPAWDAAAIETAVAATLATHGLALGKLAQPVRVAVTGGTASPGIFDVLDVLGRDRSLARLRRAAVVARTPARAPDG